MRFLLLVFILFSAFSFADYLNTRGRNHCIYNLTPNQDSSGWCYTDRNTGNDRCNRNLKMKDLINGYQLDDDGNCVLKKNLYITGLTQNQWDYLMAVMAHVVGFTVLFLVLFITVLVARH